MDEDKPVELIRLPRQALSLLLNVSRVVAKPVDSLFTDRTTSSLAREVRGFPPGQKLRLQTLARAGKRPSTIERASLGAIQPPSFLAKPSGRSSRSAKILRRLWAWIAPNSSPSPRQVRRNPTSDSFVSQKSLFTTVLGYTAAREDQANDWCQR